MGLNVGLVHGDLRGADWWDSGRHSGDRDFVLEQSFGWRYREGLEPEDEAQKRPEDLDVAETWVREHIPWEGNCERLLRLLAYLREHEDAWIEISW